MRNCRLLIVFVCVLSFALAGCKREEPTTWDSSVLVPLAHGRLTLDNIIVDSLLSADESGLWHLRFNRDLADFNLDSIVNVRDTVVNLECNLPISGSFNPGFVVPVDFGEEIHLNVPSVQLKHAVLKSGRLEYTLISSVNGDLICNFEIPGLKKNGQPELFVVSTNPGSSAAPYTTGGSIDLSGYSLDLTGASGTTFNRIATNFNILVDPLAPNPAQVIAGDNVIMQLHFVHPDLTYADGYFGEHHYNLNEQFEVGENFNLPSGVLNLDGAQMHVDVRNAVGIDAQMHFTNLSGVNASGNALMLNHGPLYVPLNISRAVRSGDQVVANTYAYELNASNSNLDAFMEFLPKTLNVAADVVLNPMGNITDGNDFIFTADALEASVSLDVPLRLGMHDLAFADTLEITADALEEVFNGDLVLWAKSDFPCEAKCDLFLIDGSDSRSIVENATLHAASLTSAMGQTAAAESFIHLPIDTDIITRWNANHRLVIRVTLNTLSQTDVVGIYDHFGIDFKLIANGDYQIHIGE